MGIMLDHFPLFGRAKHTHIPSIIVKQLKDVSSRNLKGQFSDLEYLLYPKQWKHFKHL